mmetsp:Transcript_15002/g.23236  ORF Transcript_15002/g.23236 Transcript_15002/m.23236 type:complete len:80 (+) Transcript_15002:1324-1563(+)
MMSLMAPYEWSLSSIPFICSNPECPDSGLFEYINNLQCIIMGIHVSAFEEIKERIEEQPENIQRLVVVDLTKVYSDHYD